MTGNDLRLCRAVSAFAATTLVAVFPLVCASQGQATTPTCFGEPATIVGTDGADSLVGRGEIADVIYGGGGNDGISGGDFDSNGHAPDLLCGGPGADYVYGSPGNDKLNGGDGNDYVDGSNGADLEQGNAGNDHLGGIGSFAEADSANDVLRGNSGADTLVGGWGKDQLYGGAGNDRLYDTECDGPTLLNGGRGDDFMESWYSSFDGGTLCSFVADRVRGRGGTDTAKVDDLDSVRGVEHVTRVREQP